jgi:hypothetical protein
MERRASSPAEMDSVSHYNAKFISNSISILRAGNNQLRIPRGFRRDFHTAI